MKYNVKDFEKVANGKANIEDMCEFYGVKKQVFVNAMNRAGFYSNKTKIKIVSPSKTKIVYGYNACAEELKVSPQTIRNAVHGQRVKVFEELGITIQVMKFSEEMGG